MTINRHLNDIPPTVKEYTAAVHALALARSTATEQRTRRELRDAVDFLNEMAGERDVEHPVLVVTKYYDQLREIARQRGDIGTADIYEQIVDLLTEDR